MRATTLLLLLGVACKGDTHEPLGGDNPGGHRAEQLVKESRELAR